MVFEGRYLLNKDFQRVGKSQFSIGKLHFASLPQIIEA
ncbi:hypothetical protein NEOC95_000934 [Neochlamydia sp. AcF95]|nr:hypothetical protein [Neochlamydia sp. AcF95]